MKYRKLGKSNLKVSETETVGEFKSWSIGNTLGGTVGRVT
jgi:hypothetical protein